MSGCSAPPAKPVAPPPVANAQPIATTPPAPQDAKPTGQRIFQLVMFQLAVPEGSISRNADFWKPFDEAFLSDLWKHDVLDKNGIRIGRAPLSELAAMQKELDAAESTRKELIGTNAQNVELEVRRGIDKEIVFAFNKSGLAEGRDYFSVDNLFMLSFKQVPRQPDHIHLDLCPAIRDQKKKLAMGEDGRPTFSASTSIYQVGISTELGVDECLVVAPSEKAVSVATSVGRAFLIEERPASRVEKVLVIVPRLVGNVEEVKGGRLR